MMSKFKIGDRVVDTHQNANTTNKSGVLMEHPQWLVWVRFDDESLNNTDCSAAFGEGTRCTACRPATLVLESEFNK